MSSRKRKHKLTLPISPSSHAERRLNSSTSDPAPPPSLHIQAYEATVLRGPQSTLLARSLELGGSGPRPVAPGRALIRWGGEKQHSRHRMRDDDGDDEHEDEDGADDIWVDRYDARLLLDALPSPTGTPLPASGGPTDDLGWTDLPSDAEDTFFLTPSEVEDYHRKKRRRMIDRGREARLAALRAEEEVGGGGPRGDDDEADVWAGSDEEPDETISELMRRTASHLLSSPNPGQLEMRILANHGRDARFAFLRGRFARAWRLAKIRAGVEKEGREGQREEREEKEKEGRSVGLGELDGYGDSESDGEDAGGDEGAQQPEEAGRDVGAVVQTDTVPVDGGNDTRDEDAEEAAKQARRIRAKAWIAQRRAMKEKG